MIVCPLPMGQEIDNAMGEHTDEEGERRSVEHSGQGEAGSNTDKRMHSNRHGMQSRMVQERVGIVTHMTPSIQALEWSKYVAWVCSMATAVLTRLEGYKILQDPQMASITAAMLHELTQIATVRGLTLVDMALLPTKTLSALSVDDTVAELRHLGEQRAARMPQRKISALQDLEQGKRLEVEETLGYAVRQSAALGIPTPTMDVCYKLIAGINHYLQ